MNPTIYLSNWSSHRTPGMHGPGRKLSIMAWTGPYVTPDGFAYLFIPQTESEIRDLAELIRLRRAKQAIPPALLASYRGSMESRWSLYATRHMLEPAYLHAAERPSGDSREFVVGDGDTLNCACSVAEARAGRCHRAWIAPYLYRAGWRVILDGTEVTP